MALPSALPTPTRRWIFVGLTALLAVFMTTSVFMANMMWVLLFANWVFEGRWRQKWQMARSSRLLHLVVACVLMLALSMIWTTNWHYGLFDLQVKLPLLALPLVLLTTPPLVGRERQVVGTAYVGTILVVTLIAVVRLLTIDGLPYREAVPFVSHIRFALNICLALCLLTVQVVRIARSGKHRWLIAPIGVMMAWLLIFLMVIRSYTAVIVMAVAATIVLIAFWQHFGRLRWWFAAAWVVATLGVAGLTAKYVHDYYTPSALARAPLAPCTPNGRPYYHRGGGVIENGNYIDNYICRDEILCQWPRRSQVSLGHQFDNGYELYPTLLRYLNAVGLTKDSLGIWSLTEQQVADIERGVANPVYEVFGPRRMVYVLLYERESYRCYGSVRDFSMLERFELWRTGLKVIADHPWVGVGVGDVPDKLHARLAADHSPLAGTPKHTHCQYLTLLMALGLVGGAVLLWLALRALLPRGRITHTLKADPVMTAFVVIALVSFCSEDTLETLAGILFCCFYLAFRKTGQPDSPQN